MAKVTREVCEQEVTAWLDKNKVFQSEREKNKDSYDLLVDAMTEGYLKLDDKTLEFTHTLIYPLNDVLSLTYKRFNDTMVKPHLNGVKSNDFQGMYLAHAAASTGQLKPVLAALDSADKKIMMAILVFFL